MTRARLSVSQRAALQLVRECGEMTRGELGAALELSPSGVSTLVAKLRDAGLLLEEGRPNGPDGTSRGRPAMHLRLPHVAGFGVGVDIGHLHVRVLLGTDTLEVLEERVVSLDTDREPDETLATIQVLVGEVLAARGLAPGSIVGCGVGLPAPINPTTGRVVGNNILPRWVETTPGDGLQQLLDAPVCVGNDANLGALAEYQSGVARGHRFVMYLKLAAGLGLGMVAGGRVITGAGGTAGEIGHLQIRPDGDVCRCGARGCLETVASVPRMCRALEPVQGRAVSADDLVELVRLGNPGATRVVSDAGRLVGRALADLTTILSPELIVLNGELGAANDVVRAEVRSAIDRFSLPAAAHNVEVRTSTLGARAEAIGALIMAFAAARGDASASNGRGRRMPEASA